MPVKHISVTALVLLLTNSVSAVLTNGFNTSRPEWFFQGVLPASLGISANCSRAYSSRIDCDESVIMAPRVSGKDRTLPNMCVKTCSQSLWRYQDGIKAACADEDIVGKGLEKTWLNVLLNSKATLSLYYTQCLRDIFSTESTLCQLTDADFALAWDAASPINSDPAIVRAFCANSCFTQAVVLNVPTRENLADIARMCPDGIGLEQFPFVENMKIAGILKGDEPIFRLNRSDSEVEDSDVKGDRLVDEEDDLARSGSVRVSFSAGLRLAAFLGMVSFLA